MQPCDAVSIPGGPKEPVRKSPRSLNIPRGAAGPEIDEVSAIDQMIILLSELSSSVESLTRPSIRSCGREVLEVWIGRIGEVFPTIDERERPSNGWESPQIFEQLQMP